MRVAYIMSRFPKLTETFVLFEMIALQRQGVEVEVYPLLRGQSTKKQTSGASLLWKLWEYVAPTRDQQVMHAEAAEWVERAHYQPFFSWHILLANVRSGLTKPGAYFGTLWQLILGSWGNMNFLLGGLSIFPKSVYFAQMMLRDGVTHVHAHFANHPATAALIIHRLSGIPFSFTAHGSDLHRDRRLLKEKVAEAKLVVTISNYNRDVIVEECGEQCRDRVMIVYCGVDTDIFRPSASADEKTFSTLCIGTLHEVKGQTYLLEACRLLQERGIRFNTSFIGDGPDLPMLQQQATEAGIADRVTFLGRKDRNEIAAILAETDVVVAPSVPTSDGRREGIPVVLMEAMSTGTAVVASRLSGIPELVEHEQCGLLAPPRDCEAIADALQRLHDDCELRQRLGDAARKKVMDEFDVTANAEILAGYFQDSTSTAWDVQEAEQQIAVPTGAAS